MTIGGLNSQIHQDKASPDISVGYKVDSNNLYSLIGVQ